MKWTKKYGQTSSASAKTTTDIKYACENNHEHPKEDTGVKRMTDIE